MPPPPPVPNTASIVSGPLRSVEGWVTFVTGIHEEAQQEDIREFFCDFGRIKSIVLNPDRKTGLAKGYALVEFLERNDAQDAINALHGKPLLGQPLRYVWKSIPRIFTTTLKNSANHLDICVIRQGP